MKKPKKPTDRQKIEMYENLLIRLSFEVSMNPVVVTRLLSNICRWSYVHRAGNGEPTEDAVNAAFWNLLNLD